jgi:hypothetical protein
LRHNNTVQRVEHLIKRLIPIGVKLVIPLVVGLKAPRQQVHLMVHGYKD